MADLNFINSTPAISPFGICGYAVSIQKESITITIKYFKLCISRVLEITGVL
jgi:hypothetical protein